MMRCLRALAIPVAVVAYACWELPRSVLAARAARRRLRIGRPRYVQLRSVG